ncbi:protein of unknown function [Beijerinckiaceae bacterium RH AL1]|nr:hypothetical protein [Beijerinckiaceae bacterium]VVB46699.1 protein of unknown function [Beijerinckiaceae bacterium RH CH11]VVB46783.1 protein of unknown function [Beijerinckiaceae bacterium RH AL8]VVC55511.1 protein of unknown function [Beijerinckiaceae bacterium RH AL1]
MSCTEASTRAPFTLMLPRYEHPSMRRQALHPDAIHFESLADAVRAARSSMAAGLGPCIESRGIVFLPRHIEVLLAALDGEAPPWAEPCSPGDNEVKD